MSSSPKGSTHQSSSEICNIASTAFFALRPLSTELQSRSAVPICSYTTGKGLDCTHPRLLNFQSIDLDTWAEESLKVIDIFFRPQFADAVALIDRFKFIEEQAFLKTQHITADSFTTAMLNARESLANTISQMVVPVLQSPAATSTMLQKAKNSYEEQILSKPRNTYFLDALVQASMSINEQSTSDEQNTVLPSIPVTSLSGDFISGITRSQESKAADSLYDLSFFVSTTDKEANSTIEVLIGHDQPEKIEVPIALRNYPPVPTLSKQHSSQTGGTAMTDLEKLTAALNWDYSYTYAVNQGAQDQIYSSIFFNTHTPPPVNNNEVATQPLFDSLAQFTLIREALSKDLSDSLEAIGPETTDQDPNIDKAYFAIATLVKLSNDLAKAWATYTPSLEKTKGEEPVEGAYGFIIAQAPDPNFGTEQPLAKGGIPRLLISVIPPDKLSALDKSFYPVTGGSSVTLPNLPLITLEGYEQENATDIQGKPITGAHWYYITKGAKKEYLSFQHAEELINHQVILSGFNIFKTQSALASAAIIRNEHLVQSSDTARELIYHSPMLSFAAPLIPSVTSGLQIDLSRLKNESGSKANLVNHLSDFFSLVFENSSDKRAQISLKVNWDYSESPDGTVRLTLPVLPQTGFSIETPEDYLIPVSGCGNTESSFVCKVADAMKAWYTNNQPSVNHASFQLGFTVFSTEEPASALLEFSNLIIPYTSITDL